MPNWVNLAIQEYAKRFPSELNFKINEIPLLKRNKNTNLSKVMHQEGLQMLAKTKTCDLIITLEINGKNLSTQELVNQIINWKQLGANLNFMIGGPEGLSTQVIAKKHFAWSLSNLTLPHPLVRILVVEQLYRAITILQNHPYHK